MSRFCTNCGNIQINTNTVKQISGKLNVIQLQLSNFDNRITSNSYDIQSEVLEKFNVLFPQLYNVANNYIHYAHLQREKTNTKVGSSFNYDSKWGLPGCVYS